MEGWGEGKGKEGKGRVHLKTRFFFCELTPLLLQLCLPVLFTLLFTILACEQNPQLYSYRAAFTVLAKLLPIIFQWVI